jgi:uncharacterized protein
MGAGAHLVTERRFPIPTAPAGVDDPVLAEIVRRLGEVYRPLRIYLFGSRARATPGPDSDYGLLLVVPDDIPTPLRRSAQGYDALWGLPVGADILVWTETAFVERLHLRASLPATVEREGRLLYSR